MIPDNPKRWGEQKNKSGAAQVAGGQIGGVFGGKVPYGTGLTKDPGTNRRHAYFTSRDNMPSSGLQQVGAFGGFNSLMTPGAASYPLASPSGSAVIGETRNRIVPNPEGGVQNG